MQYVVTVRGSLKGDRAQAQAVHDATIAKISPEGRELGSTAHQTFLNPENEKEFLAVDIWNNLEGIRKLYSDPNLAVEFCKLFEGEPEVVVWANSGWDSYFDTE
jgi:hypothetical protein